MLLTVAAAVIAVYFWPLTLIVLYFMYWQVTIPLTIVVGLVWLIVFILGAMIDYFKRGVK